MDRWCLITVLSALYGKLLLVIGVGFVTAELVTARIPLYFYEGYFTFLYSVSLIFVAIASSCLIRNGDGFDFSLGRGRTAEHKDGERSEVTTENNGMGSHRRRRASFIMETGTGFGSLFFRLGILGFGLATMVYCGLEFGSFFEILPNSSCYRILRGINPILQMAFTFAQMYFIFMASRPSVSKFQAWTKFGLMHLVATNLGVWIKTLVHESIQEFSFRYEDAPPVAEDVLLDSVFPARIEDEDPIFNDTCQGLQEIMGSVVATSAPYLCPFLVQFSFVSAAIFYTMWTCVDTPWSMVGSDPCHRLRSLQRRVDCVGASKGLFLGLFVLATNVICLILFFVLVNHPRFHRLAIYLAHVSHVAVMLVSLAAILVGLLRARPLSAESGETGEADRPLSTLLLHLATFGSFLYSVFGLLAGAMTAVQWHEPSLLLAASSALSVVQVTVQSLFLLQMSGRWEARAALATPRHASHAVTLLLISNVTLWVVATFEIQHAQVNPIQAEFYGAPIWSVVQAVTLPLVIFYRFQSAVMLASLWKITCLSPTK